MAGLKKDWIIIGICIVFILSTFALFVQKGSLKTKNKELQADVDSLLTSQYELKRELEEVKTKLAEQQKSAAPLQKKLDEANSVIQLLEGEKQALIEKIEALTKTPLEIPEAQ